MRLTTLLKRGEDRCGKHSVPVSSHLPQLVNSGPFTRHDPPEIKERAGGEHPSPPPAVWSTFFLFYFILSCLLLCFTSAALGRYLPPGFSLKAGLIVFRSYALFCYLFSAFILLDALNAELWCAHTQFWLLLLHISERLSPASTSGQEGGGSIN